MRRLVLSGLVSALGVWAAPALAYSDAEISQGLLANRWCNLTYHRVSGATVKKIGRFSGDGTLTIGTDREAVSSGQYGTAYGHSQGGERYRWRVQGGQLMLSEDGMSWEGYALDAYRNSSGNVILKVNRDEWFAC